MTQLLPPGARRDRLLSRWLLLAAVPLLLAGFGPRAALAERPADLKERGQKDARDAKEARGDRVDKAGKGLKGDALDTEPAQWMRFVEDGKGGARLQVATGTYKNDDGVTVRLIGAVHVGDRQYYEGLSKDFEKYDALLYEMVKPADVDAPRKGAQSQSMVSMFQRLLKEALELDFQLDDIDYTKANFVHADLDAETFAKMQDERGESIMGLMVAQMIQQMMKGLEGKGSEKEGASLTDLVDAFNSPDRARQLKLILGRSFGDLEDQMSGMQGTVLVTERNKKALSVLKNQIRDGKKNLGIFYGAAHLSDMENRLALMGFKRTGLEWRTAWDMTAKAAKPGAKPGKSKVEDDDDDAKDGKSARDEKPTKPGRTDKAAKGRADRRDEDER